MTLPEGVNQRWSLDFVSDSLVCGRRFRMLCVIDDYMRECLALGRIHRCQAAGLLASLIILLPCAAGPAQWSVIMALN